MAEKLPIDENTIWSVVCVRAVKFIAQLAISSESNESYMLGAGKSLLVHDGIDTMEQVYAKVRALTARQLTEVAEEVFSDMSRLIYK